MNFNVICAMLLLVLSAYPSDAKDISASTYTEAKAKKNIRIAKSKLTSECRKNLTNCPIEATSLIYYSAALKDYKNLFEYTRKYYPTSSTWGGADQCGTLGQENAEKEFISINYWGAYYLAKKNLKNETKTELMNMLDYAFLCHVFETFNEASPSHNWSPNESVLTDVASYIREAEEEYGSGHAAEYERFRSDIAIPYFTAFNKLVKGKEGKELTKAWAKVAVLTENARKATVAGSYPEMFATHLNQRSHNMKVLFEGSLKN